MKFITINWSWKNPLSGSLIIMACMHDWSDHMMSRKTRRADALWKWLFDRHTMPGLV